MDFFCSFGQSNSTLSVSKTNFIVVSHTAQRDIILLKGNNVDDPPFLVKVAKLYRDKVIPPDMDAFQTNVHEQIDEKFVVVQLLH